MDFWSVTRSELGTQLDLSIIFHPQIDGPSRKTIQVLEDMLQACLLDFGSHLNQYFPLAEFT